MLYKRQIKTAKKSKVLFQCRPVPD